MKISLLSALLASSLLMPGDAAAYVDPGIVGSLYQVVYILVFGVLLGFVARPARFLSDSWKKIKKFFARS